MMDSAKPSKFLRHFITVPNLDAVNRALLSCCQRLLGEGSCSVVSAVSSEACCGVIRSDSKYSLQSWRSSCWLVELGVTASGP